MLLFFGMLIFSPVFEKKSKFWLFSKKYFLIKNSEVLSTYSNYENFQLENTKSAIDAIGDAAKNFEILLGVLWGNYL